MKLPKCRLNNVTPHQCKVFRLSHCFTAQVYKEEFHEGSYEGIIYVGEDMRYICQV